MTPELDRFIALYDDMVRATDRWLAATPPDRLDWEPAGNMSGLGMSVRANYVHLLVSESLHIRDVADCADGAEMSPLDKDLTRRLSESPDLAGAAARLHTENLDRLRGLSEADLTKRVRRAGRDWVAMDFLWSLYSHRAFHLGNIDVVARAADLAVPAFYPSIARPGG